MEEIPKEIQSLWNDLLNEVEKGRFEKSLENLETSAKDSDQLKQSMQTAFQNTLPENVDPNTRAQARKELISSIQTHAFTLDSLADTITKISERGRQLLSQVFDWITGNLVDVLTNFGAHLKVDSWSIEATAGLPAGLSFSLTVTFK
ncbi:MAG TPA: hypothetical protein VJN71_03250 [Nitrososphaerales archaeon]|nr:hypothetical protein [Nitrososphaerales archaeon]